MDRAKVIEAIKMYDTIEFTVPVGFTLTTWSSNMHACNMAIFNFKPNSPRKEREKVKTKGGMR